MFVINDDLSICLTRGDAVSFWLMADNGEGLNYTFQPGDQVRMKVFGKKECSRVVLNKIFPVTEASERLLIQLDEADTKIGEVISKPVDYWYEVELNPMTDPKTIIGYDEDGPKIFKLFPEGSDIHQEGV